MSGTVVSLLLAGYWQVARRTIVRLRRVAVPTLAALGTVAANWAVAPVNTTYDVTAHGRYTLSNASRDVLRNVRSSVTITGFEHANSVRARDMNLLRQAMGIRDLKKIYMTDDLAPGKHIIFAATGVTEGSLMRGVRFFGEGTRTSSVSMTLNTGKVRFIESIHLEKKPDVKVRFA